MDKQLIEEMWTTTEQGDCPSDFFALCADYHRRKCVFKPFAFDSTDFANCVMIYRMYSSISKAVKAAVGKAIKKDEKEQKNG